MTTPFLYIPTFAPVVNGAPVPNGLLFSYEAGTTNPKPTFQDPAGIQPNTNPVQLDITGAATVRLEPGSYHFVLTDSTATTVMWDQDFYNAPYLTAADLGALLNPITATETAASITPVNFLYVEGDPRRYGAVGDGVTDDSLALSKFIGLLNAKDGQTAHWDGGRTYLVSGALPPITAKNVTLDARGSTLKCKPNTWAITGDGTTVLSLSGTGARLRNLTIDGSHFSFVAQPVGRLIQFSDNSTIQNCSFINSPAQGGRTGATGCQIYGCHFDSNANMGLECDTASYLDFTDSTFNYNGYGFGKTLATNAFAAFGLCFRFRSHHMTLKGCQALQNGRDGMCTNQGSYAIKYIGCLAWMNGDGGFTIASDGTSPSTPGNAEACYDIEYIDCESYNNYTSGLSAYNLCVNVQVIGGRYYNNHRNAGLIADQTSYNCGLYFSAGSQGIVVNTKAYDDRQLAGISAVSGSGASRTLTATNWGIFSGTFIGTIANYPQLAVYDASGSFAGYAMATAEAAGSVTIQSTAFNGVTLASIGASWSVTQRLQHNGCMLDNGCQGIVNIDGFGHKPGIQPYYGYRVISGYNSNSQNVLLPQYTLDPVNELILNPSFEADTANWTLVAASGGSAGRVTTTRRSVGSLQLVGGTSAQSTADASLDTNAMLYAANAFVEFSMWTYASLPGDAAITLTWIISSINISSSVNHPGGGWKLLRIGAFIPATSSGIIPRCAAQAGKTCFFDVGSLRVRPDPFDNRDYVYPSRGLAV